MPQKYERGCLITTLVLANRLLTTKNLGPRPVGKKSEGLASLFSGILFMADEDQEPGNQSAWQDIEWADFGNTEECQISWLPAAAKRHQTEQRRIAKDKGKQRAIGTFFHFRRLQFLFICALI